MKLKFWLRWSYRDARQRWLQVLAVALIFALGTGVFSGFGKHKDWRVESMDKSFDMLAMFDLRVELTEGSFLDQSEVESALSGIEGIKTLETRLLIPTLIDASKDGETILYPGRLIGQDVADSGPHINKLNVTEGEGFSEADSGSNQVVIDHLFTSYRKLSPGDSVEIAGDINLDFVGRGQTPENLMIIAGTGGLTENENTFAVMYMTLESVQQISGREGLVNEVLFLLTEGSDPDIVSREIGAVMGASFSDTGFNFTKKADDPVYKAMYADAKGDQRFWNIIGALFLFGAAMATFNLAGRIVESQRRQIGIGMALGVKRSWLAFRPILLGVQIAVLSTVFGLLFGYAFSRALAGVMDNLMPLAYWRDPFYIESYIQATVVGILVPVMAVLFPVWRAVRVQPIDAIQTGYLVAKGGGWSRWMQYLPIPGKSFMQMPFRNVLRSPWRTLMTILGVSIAIMLLVAISGILDTFQRTINQSSNFYTESYPDRINVVLDSFYPINSEDADQLTTMFVDADRITNLQTLEKGGQPLFSHVDVKLMMVGEYVHDGDEEMMAVIEMVDPETALWRPTLKAGKLPDGDAGIVISQKTAEDLSIWVGDAITLSHPVREGLLSYRMEETQLPVIGVHDNPLRGQAYMSLHQADLMGMEGLANTLDLYPTPGVSTETVRRTMFEQPGIASVQAVSDIADSFEEAIQLLRSVLLLIQGVVVILAFLIAFNSTSINVDERVREIATMFAFGLPIRTVTRMASVENIITGFFGTILGVIFGYFAVRWMIEGQVAEMMPEIKFLIDVSSATIFAAAVLGIVVVGLTPLLSIRKMTRMDIPATLRVME